MAISINARSIFIVMLAVSIIVSAIEATSATTCGEVIRDINSCISYVRNGGPVPPACCSGVRQLKGALVTAADRRQACACLKSVANTMPGINFGLASGLPSKCGVHVPFPISMNTDCSKIN